MRTSNIVQQAQNSHEGNGNATAMSIDDASTTFLMDALGKLYSRPAQAVLREYLSNAMDAHKAKGGELPPIQVTLPKQNRWDHKHFTPTPLQIRDFGNGMSEDDFLSIVSRYGASTKRDTNNLMGGFGLGAKSGFAVSDEFFMNSYQNGQGLRVRFFKDNLNKGYVEVVDRFPTSEPDGVLVEIPIPNANLAELSEESLYGDYPFFMGYSSEELEVKTSGNYGDHSVHNPTHFSHFELGGSSVGWLGKVEELDSKLYALVGKVVYTIDFGHLSSLALSNKAYSDLKDTLVALKYFKRTKVIEVPIGSLDMPSSREEITYSERSLQTLNAIIGKYAVLLHQYLQQRLNAQETKEKALKFLVQLEQADYTAIHNLTWRGTSLDRQFFSSSPMLYAEFSPHFGNRTMIAKGSAMKFRHLLALSEKKHGTAGTFSIIVDDVTDVIKVQQTLTSENIEAFLDPEDSGKVSNATFIITTKDDVLIDWVFNATSLEPTVLQEVVWRKEQAKELNRQLAIEKAQAEKARVVAEAKAEKARLKAEQEENRKQREARAHENFSFFDLNEYSKQHKMSSKEEYFRLTSGKTYYWSEEEIIQFATVTNGLKRISDGVGEKTCLLFPFIAYPLPNSFKTITETKKNVETNYLVQLKLFLRLFFAKDNNFLIIGKERKLDAFKATYPEIESGVLAVKKEIEAQITDPQSKIMTAYNALPIGNDRDMSELRSLTLFVATLDESQKNEVSQQILDTVEKFRNVLTFGSIRGMRERYLLEVLKAFVTYEDIRRNSYSENADVIEMRGKYPLLMSSNFQKPSKEVINHLITYIKLCDKQMF